jgi:hypothetical protein
MVLREADEIARPRRNVLDRRPPISPFEALHGGDVGAVIENLHLQTLLLGSPDGEFAAVVSEVPRSDSSHLCKILQDQSHRLNGTRKRRKKAG